MMTNLATGIEHPSLRGSPPPRRQWKFHSDSPFPHQVLTTTGALNLVVTCAPYMYQLSYALEARFSRRSPWTPQWRMFLVSSPRWRRTPPPATIQAAAYYISDASRPERSAKLALNAEARLQGWLHFALQRLCDLWSFRLMHTTRERSSARLFSGKATAWTATEIDMGSRECQQNCGGIQSEDRGVLQAPVHPGHAH